MIESESSITLTAEDATNPQVVGEALQRAVSLGRQFIIAPPGKDLALTPETASNGPLYRLASAEASKRGGTVRVVSVTPSSEKDVHLTTREASHHPTYMRALETATKQGGVVVVDP